MTWLRYYPVETLSNGSTIPFMLSLLGLLLIDISYLIGLYHLLQYRKAVKCGIESRGHKGPGWMLAVGILILLPVFVNSAQLFMGLDYSPYDLEGSGFVTMTDIEGEDFRLHGNHFYSMDYISHGRTLLDPDRNLGIFSNVVLLERIRVSTMCHALRSGLPAILWKFWQN